MTDHLSSVLNKLVPTFEGERGNWVAVARDASGGDSRPAGTAPALDRAGLARRQPIQRFLSRRLVVLAAVVAAIAVPLAAFATAQDWWFFRFGQAPRPVTDIGVVKTGTWDGERWQLVAYGSSTNGVCFGITPLATAATTGEGAAMACAQIEGVPRTSESKPYTPPAITYMAAASGRLPAHIVGPVIDTADEVEIHLADGEVVRTTTFEAPEEFGSIRFYATRLPQVPSRVGERPRLPIRKLVGFDKNGQIVACLTLPVPEEGVSLSACQ